MKGLFKEIVAKVGELKDYDAHHYIDAFLIEKGFKAIGSGIDKTAYSSPNCPFVFRVGDIQKEDERAEMIEDEKNLGDLHKHFIFPKFKKEFGSVRLEVLRRIEVVCDIFPEDRHTDNGDYFYKECRKLFGGLGRWVSDLHGGNWGYLKKADRWVIIDY
jgi:hypothetical protein